MQSKNHKFKGLEQKRSQKVTRVVAPIIKSRILFTHQSKYNENTRVSSSHNLVVPFVEGNGSRQITDMMMNQASQACQSLMLQTFERFLLQLDELFITLRAEQRYTNVCLPILNSYKDICEKLRLEILIAIDKLELSNVQGNKKERNIELLDKMNRLKSQLSQIRWQYHQAIQEFSVSPK